MHGTANQVYIFHFPSPSLSLSPSGQQGLHLYSCSLPPLSTAFCLACSHCRSREKAVSTGGLVYCLVGKVSLLHLCNPSVKWALLIALLHCSRFQWVSKELSLPLLLAPHPPPSPPHAPSLRSSIPSPPSKFKFILVLHHVWLPGTTRHPHTWLSLARPRLLPSFFLPLPHSPFFLSLFLSSFPSLYRSALTGQCPSPDPPGPGLAKKTRMCTHSHTLLIHNTAHIQATHPRPIT